MATKEIEISLAELFCHIPKGKIRIISADFTLTASSSLVILEAHILDGNDEMLTVIHVPVSMRSYSELCVKMAGPAKSKPGPTKSLRRLKR